MTVDGKSLARTSSWIRGAKSPQTALLPPRQNTGPAFTSLGSESAVRVYGCLNFAKKVSFCWPRSSPKPEGLDALRQCVWKTRPPFSITKILLAFFPNCEFVSKRSEAITPPPIPVPMMMMSNWYDLAWSTVNVKKASSKLLLALLAGGLGCEGSGPDFAVTKWKTKF